jgi:hypothetical protein
MADTSFTSKGLNTALSALNAPTNLVASVAGELAGTSGIWSYIVTAFNGGESVASTGITFTNSAHTGVQVAFTTVANATDYRLYRSGQGFTGYQLVANVASGSPVIDTFNSTVSGYSGFYLGSDTSAFESRAMGSKVTRYYVAPAETKTLLKEVVVSNGHGAAVTFDLHVTPSGESAAHGNRIMTTVSLDSAETKILSLNTVLETGDGIWAKCSEIGYIPGYGSVSIKISGIEISEV